MPITDPWFIYMYVISFMLDPICYFSLHTNFEKETAVIRTRNSPSVVIDVAEIEQLLKFITMKANSNLNIAYRHTILLLGLSFLFSPSTDMIDCLHF